MARWIWLIALSVLFVFGCEKATGLERGDDDTGGDTDGDTDADTDTDSDSDSDECPFDCISTALCDQAGGEVSDEYVCEDSGDVCCDFSCPYECMPDALCDTVGGTIYDEFPCADEGESCCDWGSDTDVDTDTDTDTDTDADTDTDTDTDTDSDTGSSTDTSACPFACMSLTLCNLVEGVVWEEYECEDSDVCCNTGEDTDTEIVCGNGYVEGDEECDDTNTVALDGCSPICEYEFCGDDLVGSLLSLTEGFETGNLNGLPWDESVPYSFEVVSDVIHTGSYSMRSDNYAVSSSMAEIEVDQYTEGEVCFWYRGESQATDYLRFRVDGVQAFQDSGSNLAWEWECVSMDAGIYTFTWQYVKDASTNAGLDQYWIDDITFSLDYEEDCDDGNTTAGDGCSPICLFEECGNEYIDFDEECDDGNTDGGDGCSPT
ncbi:MAG: hypothetical protein JRF63_03865, partial [Deltaproteobacteria bacterium]|nr:hypothetical protein [Deltaproteobacteria bacterium]